MKVGITQRVDFISEYSETRDSIDQRWYELFEVLGIYIIPIPNGLKDIKAWLNEMKCDAFILSGGNDIFGLKESKNISKARDKTEFAILKYSYDLSIPVFGVCRGFQVMNIFFGGKLQRVSGHVATSHSIKFCFDPSRNWDSKEVNSFHEWGISKNNLAKELIPCAFDNDDNVEAAINRDLKWLGVMWHPERNEIFDNFDLDLLRKLFKKDLV